MELVPLALMLGNPRVENRLPWCVRLDWTTQVIRKHPLFSCMFLVAFVLRMQRVLQLMDLLKRLRAARTLICNLVSSNFFVNATSLDIFLDQGSVQLQYSDQRLQGGKWCFSNELCQTCFLHASKGFLRDGQCDMDLHKCVVSGGAQAHAHAIDAKLHPPVIRSPLLSQGFDGVSQAQVVVRKVIQHLFDKNRFPETPPKISRKKLLVQVNDNSTIMHGAHNAKY